MDFASLALQCAPNVPLVTIQALVKTESSFNPFAIGVVNGALERQPRSLDEALAAIRNLDKLGYKYSAGLSQIFVGNWPKYGLTQVSVFDTCQNLRVGGIILGGCFTSAKRKFPAADEQALLGAAFSCYYSGNFQTGFKAGYVQTVIANALGKSASSVRPPAGQGGAKARAPREREILNPDFEGVQRPVTQG